MKITETLTKIGLTNNEISIYLYLLEAGVKPGAEIIFETKLEKSSVYKAVKSLVDQGLIVSSGSIRKQVFAAIPASEVINKFDLRIKEIEMSKVAFQGIAEELSAYTSDKYKSDSIAVFTGNNGNTQYHKAILSRNTTFMKTIASTQVQHSIIGPKEYVAMNKWFIKQRVANNISVSVLYDASCTPDEYDKSNAKLLKECRQLEVELNLPSVMSITNESVFFSTQKRGSFWGIQISDRTIAVLLKSIFEVLWSQAKII